MNQSSASTITAIPCSRSSANSKRSLAVLARIVLWICVGVILSQRTPTVSADDLAWKFAEGDRFKVAFVQTLEQESEVVLKPSKLRLDFTLEMTWNVKSVDAEGTATIEQKFSRFSVKSSSDKAAPLEFDSDKLPAKIDETPEAGELAHLQATMAILKEATFTTTMNKRGGIVSVTVPRETLDKLRGLPTSMRTRQLFTAESIEKTLGTLADSLPGKEVQVGETWTSSVDREVPIGTMKAETTYKLDSVDEVEQIKIAKISSTTATTFTPRKSDDAKSPATAVTENTLSGTMEFDVTNGMIKNFSQTQRLVTTKPYREMKINTKSTQVANVSITKLAGE